MQNFIIKIAVLYLSLCCNKLSSHVVTTRGLGKIVLAALLGTITEILGLLWSSSYDVFILCVHLLEVPVMVRFVLGKERRRLLPIILSGYFFIMVINGFLEILWNQFGEKGSYIFYLIFSCVVVTVGGRIWKNYTRMRKGIFAVEVRHHGKIIRTHGFYDSGNRLIDPYTGNGVHIISEQLRKRLELQEETAVFVPYQALGNEKGILKVYYVDELMIDGEKGRKIIQKCPLGVTKDNLFEGKKYEIILNEEVF
ncbi:MAG: sigma-E processing peptidase SpoIIGA [Agathobacter sp.]|nr:sigma-E processing peptidase SpoIIGA [Agathobacter sp.]